MRWLVLLAGCAAFTPSLAPPFPAQLPEKTPWPAAEAIRAATTRPSFAGARFAVVDYGARGDGVHDDTAAFEAAIAACNHAGGGHLIVPAGVYLVGALRLFSHVDLHLEHGATLRFSGDAGQ